MSAASPVLEAAQVWRAGCKRYFTRKAAEREIVRQGIRAFLKATGDDGLPSDTYAELATYLLAFVQRDEPITHAKIDEFFNPHHYPTEAA